MPEGEGEVDQEGVEVCLGGVVRREGVVDGGDGGGDEEGEEEGDARNPEQITVSKG